MLQLAVAESQFTQRLEWYGGVTTDHICRSSASPLGCGCCVHEAAADDDREVKCEAHAVGDDREPFELRHDKIHQETSRDVPAIKDWTSSGIPRGYDGMLIFIRTLVTSDATKGEQALQDRGRKTASPKILTNEHKNVHDKFAEEPKPSYCSTFC